MRVLDRSTRRALRRLRVEVAELDCRVPALRAREIRAAELRAGVGFDLLPSLARPKVRGGRYTELSERPPPRKPRKSWRAHRVGSGVVHQGPSVWDMLLPVLMPPLDARFEGAVELPHPLYRYQVDGIDFLRTSKSALLADEMGTGKTVMSAVAMRLAFREGSMRRALVVCPLSLLGVWDRHLAEWAPELRVTVVHGDARTRWRDWRCPAHVWIATYDTLRTDVGGALDEEHAAAFDLLLLDEAQTIKNHDSGRTRAVRAVPARWRWALSGTPIENRLGDLVSLFAVLRPGLLPDCELTPAQASDLIGPYVKRRTKAEVMKELPPKIRQDEWLELDEEQERAYRAAEAEGCAELEALGDEVSRVHVFSLITRLKRICNFAPGCETSPKLRSVEAKVESIQASGKKVLVFTQWLEEGVDKVGRALERYGVVRFDSRLGASEREAAIARFREDPAATVFLATVKSAGVGLTLTEASYVIHFDHWWNPAWMWQAEDRAHRKGQNEPVNVYSLWMAGTLEERIWEILEHKGCLQGEILDGLSEGAADGVISLREWLCVLGVRGGRK